MKTLQEGGICFKPIPLLKEEVKKKPTMEICPHCLADLTFQLSFSYCGFCSKVIEQWRV
jgi:hypothetical protein